MKKDESDLRDRTKAFALAIIRLFGALSKSTEAQVLGRQVLRSGTSVGANYREAYRARSKAEFRAKCGDSLKELEETAYWLELLADSKLGPEADLAVLYQECDELTAIFVTIIKNSKATKVSARGPSSSSPLADFDSCCMQNDRLFCAACISKDRQSSR